MQLLANNACSQQGSNIGPLTEAHCLSTLVTALASARCGAQPMEAAVASVAQPCLRTFRCLVMGCLA